MKKGLYLLAASGLFFAACQQTEVMETPSAVTKTVEFTASMEEGNGSRTAFDGDETSAYRYINWQENDALTIFMGKSELMGKLQLVDGAGTPNAAFQGNITIWGGIENEGGNSFANVAYYPYSEDITVSFNGEANTYDLSVVLPSVQGYAANATFAQNVSPMVAVTESRAYYELDFKNVSTWLQLYVKGTAKVSKIVMKAKNDKISGPYTLTASNTAAPVAVMSEDAENKITLDCGEGVQLSEDKATVFTFTTVPFEFAANEITFDIYDTDGTYMPNAYTITASSKFVRGQYHPIKRSNPVVYANPVSTPVAVIGNDEYRFLTDAVEAAGENAIITLIDDVVLSDMVTIPADKKITIDLAGYDITMSEGKETTTYAFNNLGELTLMDSSIEGTATEEATRAAVEGGSVSARGIYNGYDANGAYVATAKIIVKSGTYNALGTNGGAAIFNYGIAEIKGGNFTSKGGYSLNNQSGSSMTVEEGVTANNGIYNSGATLIVEGGDIKGNRSGCHVVYAWNSTLTINGGNFYNNNSGNATIFSAGTTETTIEGGTFGIADGRSVQGWTSCLTDAANTAKMTVNGGTFNGGFRVQAGTTMTINGGSFNDCYGSGYNIYGTVEVKGGTYTDETAQDFAEENSADGYQLVDGTVEVLGYTQDAEGNYSVTTAKGLKTALEAAGAAGAGNTTVTIMNDLDMTGVEWTPIKVDGYHGADIVTVEGNHATIKGLTAPLFAGGFAGGSGLVINNLTIDQSTIVSTNTLGSGAFIESSDSQAKIELVNCKLTNSSVSGSRTGGLVGWTSGYSNVNDGPVKSYITFKNCVVANCTITGSSVGGINGHAGASDWTYTTIENCTVTNCNLNSTDDGGWRVGVAVGTANIGEVTITNLTESGNVLTQTGKTAPTGEKRNYFGRFVPGTTGKLVIDGVQIVIDKSGLQAALNNATGEATIALAADITGDVTVAQKENVVITIEGNNHTYNGVIIVDGKSARYDSAGLTIQNLNFNSESISADAYINLGKEGDNNTRYTNHVTVSNCTFTGANNEYVAVKSYTGGDKNLTITGCTVNTGMHSMAQLTNVEEGLKFDGCKVYSKNGINLNNTPALTMSGCEFDVKGYAVRFGVNGNTLSNGVFNISGSTLKSECEGGDAVIIFRGTMSGSVLNLTNTTLDGETETTNNAGATIVNNG